MKSLADLLVLLLRDCGGKCGVDVERDVKTLRSRVEHEGNSFMTISLVTYAQGFDQSLSNGHLVPGLFASFGKRKSGAPEFLQGFLHHVFDPVSGALRENPSLQAIVCIRQICRFQAKVDLPCSDSRNAKALESYRSTDQACRGRFQYLPTYLREEEDEGSESEPFWARTRLGYIYKNVAATLVASMCLEDEDGNVPVRCIHGPGATVEACTPNGKYNLGYWHSRLEEAGLTYLIACFGAEKPLWSDVRVGFQPVYVDPVDEAPVKVVLVPKTLKSPRVIGVEPTAMQFAQQGLASVLRSAIDHCRYTSGRINFRDQSVNQEKAIEGSKSSSVATIDLKDASDRVGCDLVDVLFRGAPDSFRKLLWATRSSRAKLPGGEVLTLKKFASMGSAMCFPVEALVFYTIAVSARVESHRLPCTPTAIQKMTEGVYVYGDDICCPAHETPQICRALEVFGLQVNYRKTFWSGNFRESCGVDAFRGERVTPTYLTRTPPANRGCIPEIVSSVATANQLYKAGYYRAANALRKSVERVIGKLPMTPERSPALGWEWFSDYSPPRRWNWALQRFEYRCWVPSSVFRPDPLEGDGAWAKCVRRIGLLGFNPSASPSDHLDVSARPYVLALKRKWVEL